jgi:2,5-diamino-6-(ribosylamino)-4(3H)-pyrimidinone 5'-phosphate reductase
MRERKTANPLPPLKPRLRNDLPFVYLNVAITADGKLAPANRQFVPFSSKRDQELLLLLRTRCDAVMAGARTVDAVPVNLGPGGKRYREQRIKNKLSEHNIRVVVTGSASLDPKAEIFRHKFSPIIILTTGRAPRARVARLKERGAIVHVSGESEIDFVESVRWLRREWNVKRLLCEGGGEINEALFRAHLVDQVYVTCCPVIFGGRAAPTLAEGAGVQQLSAATRLKLSAAQKVNDELYLVYDIDRRGAGGSNQ